MRTAAFAISALAAVLVAGRMASSSRQTAGTVREHWPLMGTVWSAEIAHQGRIEAARAALLQVEDELKRIDALMSEWKEESPVSAINRAAGKELVDVPVELRALIERSVRYSERSSGAFDITWRGMGRIWRFDDRFAVPTAEAVERARRMVNYRDIRIAGDRVGLARAGMSIGLGGIAKGYAVDRAGKVLVRAGFTDYLVDGGGDILVSGKKNGRPWRLGVQDPRAERGALLGSVNATAGVLVTSGDYERFRIAGGVRYHHIIDPATGWPAAACQQVSLLADTAERAVVLAKVIFIEGASKGLETARKEGVEALIIDREGRRHWTYGFQRRFEGQ